MRFNSFLIFIIASLAFIPAAPVAGERSRSVQQTQRRGQEGQGGRIRPPTTLSCDVNNTTSFTGRLLSYARNRQRIFLRIRTDEATTEQFIIPLARNEDAATKFLFKGETFKLDDWRKIEIRRSRLRQGMRATIWACYVNNEPKAELVDWQPRETQTNSVY
ncbi:MAG TPA: hypothetical protein VGC66_14670 [Pyrinomonadaceae bacterium]|jgi:hypothetical protein